MAARSDDEFVSASDLARLGTCERQVEFEALFGEHATPAQRRAKARGLVAHQAFYAEAQRVAAASERKGRCFTATVTLGRGPETAALRAFRELSLRRSFLGRRFILAYYTLSPAGAGWLAKHPKVNSIVAGLLRGVAAIAAVSVLRRLQCRHG